MSTDAEDDELLASGVPQLTPLGKQIELLRIERRMSKRVLAQRAGTSRQQLWRVMTGKSELTSSLCARLSEVLEIDSRVLRDSDRAPLESGPAPRLRAFEFRGHDGNGSSGHAAFNGAGDRFCETLEEYVSTPAGLERTFDTLPKTNDGRRLKRVLLDAIEDIAISRSLKLPQSIFDLRRSIVNADD
jgi:transcriptional regulator with XRE-family HTH domain